MCQMDATKLGPDPVGVASQLHVTRHHVTPEHLAMPSIHAHHLTRGEMWQCSTGKPDAARTATNNCPPPSPAYAHTIAPHQRVRSLALNPRQSRKDTCHTCHTCHTCAILAILAILDILDIHEPDAAQVWHTPLRLLSPPMHTCSGSEGHEFNAHPAGDRAT